MKIERAVIELVIFRDDADGTQDLDAIWRNLEDALYQIEGVQQVSMQQREVTFEGADLQAQREIERREALKLARIALDDDSVVDIETAVQRLSARINMLRMERLDGTSQRTRDFEESAVAIFSLLQTGQKGDLLAGKTIHVPLTHKATATVSKYDPIGAAVVKIIETERYISLMGSKP